MSARDRVLESALVLFNDQGVGPVTTNHIASHAGISPGNLYYHFSNKAAIVRALFANMDRLLSTTFRILVEYRFFYREPVPLTRADPELAAQYGQLRQRGREGFTVLRRTLAGTGWDERGQTEGVRLLRILLVTSPCSFWSCSVRLRSGSTIRPFSVPRPPRF